MSEVPLLHTSAEGRNSIRRKVDFYTRSGSGRRKMAVLEGAVMYTGSV